LYRQGVFKSDGFRVQVDFGGMFGNPNDMAIHLVIFTPVAFVLGIATKNKISKLIYFAAAAFMVAGNMVTLSRGGFLGLIAVAGVLAWKLGKKQRFKVVLVSSVIGLLVIALAPGNYGIRILSIFIPALDPVGSSDQRSELLKQSILVTLRNPMGIGIGNFPVVGLRNLQTHNAFTQVSSELGWLAFAAYLILLISPIKKLNAIERRMFAAEDFSWIYYLSIGVQASIIGYMVSSFFGPIAYNWFVYYPIAYAVCLRRLYQLGETEKGIETETETSLTTYFKLQKA
jgi:O-antigen ligase